MKYDYYIDGGCCYFQEFVKANPYFDNPSFYNHVFMRNKADRDSGETADIARHEVLRLAYEWEEQNWRFDVDPKYFGTWPENRTP